MEFSWVKDEVTKCLQPVTIPAATPPAPDYILKLIRCSCSLESPCNSRAVAVTEANWYVRCLGNVRVVHVATNKPELLKRKPLMMRKVTIDFDLEECQM